MFWRGRAWDLSPRRLFACVEALLREDSLGVAALFYMGKDCRSLLELHLNSSRWRQSWMEDVALRRDFLLSFYLTRATLRELQDHRHADQPLSELTKQLRLALPCLGMGKYDLLAATVAVAPYNADRWIDEIRNCELELSQFTYDEDVHEDNPIFDQSPEGEAFMHLAEAACLFRGVSHLWAWREPGFGPLRTTVPIPPHLELNVYQNNWWLDGNVYDGATYLLADLLGLQFAGTPVIEPGWGPPPSLDIHHRLTMNRDLDLAPLAAALRYFYQLRSVGPDDTANVIREIIEGGHGQLWTEGARFMLLAHLRINDERISAAIRGVHFSPYYERTWSQPRGEFDQFVADAGRDLGLFRPRREHDVVDLT